MPALRIENFGGMTPIADARKLPDTASSYAAHTRLDGGDLRAYWAPQVLSAFGSNVDRLYRYTAPDNSRRWLTWTSSGARVDPVPSPIPQDESGRLYWTTKGLIPAYAKTPTAVGQPGLVVGVRRLGIPKPLQKPVASIPPTAVGVSQQPTSISNAAPAVVKFGSAHAFKEGDRVKIITQATAAGNDNMYELSGKEFIVGRPPSATNPWATSIELRSSDTVNYTPFTSSNGAIVSLVISERDFESRSYVFTLVSDIGEEGPPSAPSDVVEALIDGTMLVAIPSPRPANNYDHVNRVRIYRTLSGTQGAKFYYVDELPLDAGGLVAGGTFTDTKREIELGEELPSETWTAPVDGMFGLTSMPNGFMVALKGNTVYACEAYQPHAWPDAFRKTLDWNAVAAAPLGQSAVIGTEGRPYLLTGSDPGSLTATLIELDAPCVSAAGMVNVGIGVAYPTHEGLALITSGSASIITQSIMSKQQWLDLWGSNMQATFKDGLYIALSPDVSRKSFAIRMEGERPEVIMFDSIVGKCPAIDSTDDSLHFITAPTGSFRTLTRWDSGPTRLPYTWTSKVFTQDKPVSFAVGQLFASSYPVTVSLSASTPAAGGASGQVSPITSVSVLDSMPFRLPAGFLAREWQVTIAGTASVQYLALASSMTEIRYL